MKRSVPISLLLILMLFGIVGGGKAVEPETVTIQLKWQHAFQFAGYYAALEKGYYAEEGLSVALAPLNPRKSPVRSVLDDDAQYGVADAGLLLEYLKGRDVVLLRQIFQHSPLVLLTLEESGISAAHHLRGRDVMIDRQGYGAAPVEAMIMDTLGSLNLVNTLGYSFTLNDLLSGKVDAYLGYLTAQPYELQQRGVKFNTITPSHYGIDFYGDNLFTSGREIATRPERVEKMIRATLKGWTYALAHPEEIADLIRAKYAPQLSRERLLYEAKMTNLMILSEITPLGYISGERYEAIFNLYRRIGATTAANIDLRAFIYGSSYRPRPQSFVQLTEQERQWLQDHPVVNLYTTSAAPPYQHQLDDGTLVGILPDLLDVIEERIGIRFEVHVVARDRLIERLQAGEFSTFGFAAEAGITTDFPYLTSQSVVQGYLTLYGHANEERMTDPFTLRGKTFAVPNGLHPEIREGLEQQNTVVLQQSPKDCIGALLSGKVHYFLYYNEIAQYHLRATQQSGIRALHTFPEPANAVLTIHRDEPLLHSIINKALTDIKARELPGILSKWYGREIERPPLRLSADEQAWLAEHPRVRVVVDPQWAPIEFRDNTGQHQGISTDYLQRLEALIGIRLETVGEDLSWREGVEKVRNKELDIVASMNRKGQHLRRRNELFKESRNFSSGSTPNTTVHRFMSRFR